MSTILKFKQRKLYSDFLKNLLGKALIEINISPNEIVFKTKKNERVYKWNEIEKATIEKKDIRCGYPGGGTVEDKKLILKTYDKQYKINVSRIRAEFEESSKMLKELKKYIKITEKRIK